MKVSELPIAGSWLFEPPAFHDERGVFVAPFQAAVFREALGFDLTIAQCNHSVSARGVVRGVHYASTPPGQAKYVSCTRGALLDVVVDLRVGSPTFGRVEAVELAATSPRAVYVAEGLGHAVIALEDESIASYLCSTPYAPAHEFTLDALDPELALPVPPDLTVIRSARDRAAVSLGEALAAGTLPTWQACLETYRAHLTAGRGSGGGPDLGADVSTGPA